MATIDVPKNKGLLCPLYGEGIEGRKLKQLQGTSTDVKWLVIASLIITLEGKR